MKTAVLDGLIVASPCKVDGAATEHAAERPIATVGEVEALSAAMPDRLRLLVLLATWTQLRRGELLALRRRDIDPMRSMIHIAQSRTFARDGKSITKAPKTPAGRRSLAAPRSLMTEVESHLDRFVRNDPDALVFTGVTGVPLTAGVLQQAWQRARSRVGREDLHIHDLRHTGLTLAAATGATTAELMHRAGHASPSAALRYQHATEDRDRVLAEALGEFVSPTRITEVELAQDRAE
jgi:integrase